jgi:hypothetical protein
VLVQEFVQIDLRIRLRAVTDFVPPVVILVSVVSGSGEGKELLVVLVEIKPFVLRTLKATVKRVLILGEVGSKIS